MSRLSPQILADIRESAAIGVATGDETRLRRGGVERMSRKVVGIILVLALAGHEGSLQGGSC